MSFFKADSISAGYGKERIIDCISFELDCGLLTGILGANGSGKTTLLKSICSVLPHDGTCTLDGVILEKLSVRQLSRLCSYIPQRSGISIDLSALEVVLMGFNPFLGILEHPDRTMTEKASAALKMVGLSDMEQMNYLHMSEGQKQLCILARTIAADSRLLLLDEPESALDFHYRYHVLDIIRSWLKDTGGGAVVTLHDPQLALNYCDKLLLLHEGKLLGILNPRKDTAEHMACILSQIYGPVSLQHVKSRTGKDTIIMLREDYE